ncbi:MAG: hypothetical protein RL077_3477 [Verrucomicrobiota bacterium]
MTRAPLPSSTTVLVLLGWLRLVKRVPPPDGWRERGPSS